MQNHRKKITGTLLGLMAVISISALIGCSSSGDSDVSSAKEILGADYKPTVQLAATDDLANENGEPATFTITLSAPATSDLTINYSVSDESTATPAADYEELSGTVLIAAGEVAAEISIRPIDDTDADGVETVMITLEEGDGYLLGTEISDEIGIKSDDVAKATITVSDSTVSETELKGSFVITLEEPADSDVTVTYEVLEESSADLDEDYDPLSGTVTVESGSRSVEIPVTLIDDILPEGEQTIKVKLLTVSGNNEIGDPNIAELTVTSDERPTVTIEATDDVASEDGDQGTFLVSVDVPLNEDLIVSYSTGGDALFGTDYYSLSGEVVIYAGETDAIITITPIPDFEETEGPETVTLTITSAPDCNIGTPAEATVTIIDGIAPIQIPRVTLKAIDNTANEQGDTGAYEISIDRSLAHKLNINIAARWDSSEQAAIPGVDYQPLPTQVTIEAGHTSTTIIIAPIDDGISEPDEMVGLEVLKGTGYYLPMSSFTSKINNIVSIAGDNPKPLVKLYSNDNTAIEGEDTASFTVEIDRELLAPITVYYQQDHYLSTAEWGRDAELVSGSFTLAPGQTTATQTVIAVDDNLPEGRENLNIYLTPSAEYSIAPLYRLTTLEIISTDELPLISVVATDPSASEVGLDTGTFTISLDRPATNDLVINLYPSGTATAGIDYIDDIPRALRIPRGETSATVTITPINDTLEEEMEYVLLTARSGRGYSVDQDFKADSPIISLESDEAPLTVSIIAVDKFASESGGTGTFRVFLSQEQSTDMVFTCHSSESAEEGTDYVELPTEITIRAGETSRDITIIPIDDRIIEETERVSLEVKNGELKGKSDDLDNVYIQSNDDAPTVMLLATKPIAREADEEQAVFTVQLDRLAVIDMNIGFGIQDITANSNDFVIAAPIATGSYYTEGSVTVRAGETTADIIITPVDDTEIESLEHLSVYLLEDKGEGGKNYVRGVSDKAICSLKDNDTGPLASIIAINPIANEAGTGAIFEISLNQETHPETVVHYEVIGDYANDYLPLPGTATIGANQSSVEITLTAEDDIELEPYEELRIELLPGIGYGIDYPDDAHIFIKSNE